MILSIPLAERPYEDFQVWSAEASGEYTARNAYKLLQSTANDPRAYALQADYKDFYRKLWLLDLSSKIKITVWKISWNFLATRVNMLLRRLTNTSMCPRCGSGTESMKFFFRECPGDRNNRLHKKGSKSGKEIGRFVNSYISELDAVGKNNRQTSITVKKWEKPVDRVVKINFDAAYKIGQNKAAIGVVARDKEGSVLLSCSEVHQRVSLAFGAEAIACWKALQIGVHMQWERVIIEGDYLSIIKKCKTKSPDKSLVSAYIHDIHQLLLYFKECESAALIAADFVSFFHFLGD
ncbi:hypothetical protein Gogos_022198 [Gossypium gossypioides]|uniref:RNase H type-1 domain-containing protein n=1 Tax=Gossypium gossypioides TaxID=34282 RepID=A0A7J9D4I5_GOSGO|nr:hypothetical protein [Gossypium gossypioides]